MWGVGHLLFHFPDCTVIVDEHLVDILQNPRRYRLPCVSHRLCPVTRGVPDGYSWQWNEFRLTSHFFPGQTLYHDALLVEGRGKRLLFTGDSFGPGLWMADYCAQNRNLLGEDEGFHLGQIRHAVVQVF